MNELNILDLILDASFVVQLIMGILLALSLLGWAIIVRLFSKLSGAERFDDEFRAWFFSSNNLTKQYQAVAKEPERTGLEQVFYVGYDEFVKNQQAGAKHEHLLDAIERKFRVALGHQQGSLEQGLPTLASIGSVSPYIGLFGTVWGIMNAFIGLSGAQSVSLNTVAPGIAEALIATAIGLFAAIPASLAFNYFTAKANRIYENRSLFCEELSNIFAYQNTLKQGNYS